jgi:ABC-type dipeptide/oligopeptide/nickel transport system permease component
MGMKSYLAKRVLTTLLTFVLIATVIFFLFRQLGDPAALFMSADMTAEQLEEIRASFGLDQPLYVQYLNYIVGIFTFDFGLSIFYMEPTGPLVIERLQNSLLLTIPSIFFAYVVGIGGGVILAWKRGEPVERFGLVTALIFRSSPRFWVGLLLLFVFSGILGWFPSAGMLAGTNSFDSHLELLFMPDFYMHAILPIISMTLYLIGLPLLLMRTSMLEVIHEEFVDLARAKGMSETGVMYKHVARNALLPVLTAFAVAIAFSFGGNVLVETVFSYPGVGRLMVNSALRNDYPVAQFAFLVMAGAVLLMNLVADLLYGVLDPRVTYDD